MWVLIWMGQLWLAPTSRTVAYSLRYLFSFQFHKIIFAYESNISEKWYSLSNQLILFGAFLCRIITTSKYGTETFTTTITVSWFRTRLIFRSTIAVSLPTEFSIFFYHWAKFIVIIVDLSRNWVDPSSLGPSPPWLNIFVPPESKKKQKTKNKSEAKRNETKDIEEK